MLKKLCATGGLVFSPFFGYAADKVGRRPVMLVSILFFAVGQTGLIFCYDIVTFTVVRFLLGALRQVRNQT